MISLLHLLHKLLFAAAKCANVNIFLCFLLHCCVYMTFKTGEDGGSFCVKVCKPNHFSQLSTKMSATVRLVCQWSRYLSCLIDLNSDVTQITQRNLAPETSHSMDNKWMASLNFYYEQWRSYLKWEISRSSQYWWIISYLQWKQPLSPGR